MLPRRRVDIDLGGYVIDRIDKFLWTCIADHLGDLLVGPQQAAVRRGLINANAGIFEDLLEDVSAFNGIHCVTHSGHAPSAWPWELR